MLTFAYIFFCVVHRYLAPLYGQKTMFLPFLCGTVKTESIDLKCGASTQEHEMLRRKLHFVPIL